MPCDIHKFYLSIKRGIHLHIKKDRKSNQKLDFYLFLYAIVVILNKDIRRFK